MSMKYIGIGLLLALPYTVEAIPYNPNTEEKLMERWTVMLYEVEELQKKCSKQFSIPNFLKDYECRSDSFKQKLKDYKQKYEADKKIFPELEERLKQNRGFEVEENEKGEEVIEYLI